MLCRECQKPLPLNVRSNQVYCDKECARIATQRQWREKNPKSPLGEQSRATIAEVNEMRVCIDLLARGYEVYRAAFQGMPCDLLVRGITGNRPTIEQTIRVEVTSGSYTPAGKLAHPERDNNKYDVLAVVVGDKITYKPDIEVNNWKEKQDDKVLDSVWRKKQEI